MAIDGVPWMVGGGAEHSPEIARALAHAATNGTTGVALPGDLKISPLAVPGTSIRIAPGVCALVNANAGARGESYIGRAATETQVAVDAAGAGGRNDVAILRVEDPQYAPWGAPPDLETGPYFKPIILKGISAGNIATMKSTKSIDVLGLTYPAIGLGTIELPANTGTVQQAHLTDIRQLAAPRAMPDLKVVSPAANQELTSSAGQIFPAETTSVLIPKWATEMQIKVDIASVGHIDGAAQGVLQIFLDPTGSGRRGSTQLTYDFPAPAAGGERRSLVIAGVFSVADLAGTTRSIRLEGTRSAGAGKLVTRAGTQVVFDIRFAERVA